MAELEQRVTALEQDHAQIRAEWATVQQAPLLNARLLNALRETQLEHSKKFEAIDRRFEAIDRTLTLHSQKFQTLEVGQQMIVSMLTTLIERDEAEGRTDGS